MRLFSDNKLCGRPPQYAPAPCKLTFDLLTLKVVSESRVMWATSVPILVFLGLSVLDLGPMYVTDRQTDRRQTDGAFQGHSRLTEPTQIDWLTTTSYQCFQVTMALSRIISEIKGNICTNFLTSHVFNASAKGLTLEFCNCGGLQTN